MTNELVTLQDAVRSQIKETVMKAIPSETIDKIVMDYFNGEFKDFVKKELQNAIAEKFREDVNAQATCSYDLYGRNILRNVSSEIASGIMEGFQRSIVNSVMGNLQNTNFRNY
jgi:hypothetical protein